MNEYDGITSKQRMQCNSICSHGLSWSHIILAHYFIMFNSIELAGMITKGLIHGYVHFLYPYCFHDCN
jgi:hypothetical protein